MSVQKRLEHALLATGMMNERFVRMIADGEVSEEYVEAAFKNYQRVLDGFDNTSIQYVLGVLVNPTHDRILLLWKKRPQWQAGKLNCIGGVLRDDESVYDAIHRCFKKETGFIEIGSTVAAPRWLYVGSKRRPSFEGEQDENSYELHVLVAELDFDLCLWDQATSSDDEDVTIIPLNREILHRRGVQNLSWIVDAALCALQDPMMIDVRDAPLNLRLEGCR